MLEILKILCYSGNQDCTEQKVIWVLKSHVSNTESWKNAYRSRIGLFFLLKVNEGYVCDKAKTYLRLGMCLVQVHVLDQF